MHCHNVGAEPAADSSDGMSTKKLAILFGLAFAGAILVIQMVQGFPLKDLFQPSKTEVVSVSTRLNNTCIVTPSDERPREITNCTYSIGDNITITYNPTSAVISSSHLSSK